MNPQKLIIALVAAVAAGVGVMTWTQGQVEEEPAADVGAETQEVPVAQPGDGPVARITEEELAEGFVPLIGEWENGGFNKHGWNHYGPGWFTLDHETGVLTSHGGMGLLWHSAQMFGDFTLRLEFMTSVPESNSGVFLRVPEMVTSDEYIYHSFEIQIHAAASEAIHRTGAVYDAEGPTEDRAREPGEWNDMEISFIGDQITVSLNGEQVTDWTAEPRGKITDFAERGYIGLQNHDWETSVYFRNIRIKTLD
ncbi:MAG: DUF1080 domain-containing protein [marine benthic group bacterium]|nr:DUF1080 domain-containing protein [Candidatus Benthicola marisminoris]